MPQKYNTFFDLNDNMPEGVANKLIPSVQNFKSKNYKDELKVKDDLFNIDFDNLSHKSIRRHMDAMNKPSLLNNSSKNKIDYQNDSLSNFAEPMIVQNPSYDWITSPTNTNALVGGFLGKGYNASTGKTFTTNRLNDYGDTVNGTANRFAVADRLSAAAGGGRQGGFFKDMFGMLKDYINPSASKSSYRSAYKKGGLVTSKSCKKRMTRDCSPSTGSKTDSFRKCFE